MSEMWIKVETKMTFEFSEEMIRIALEANGWSLFYSDNNWVHESFEKPDFSGVPTKIAFQYLLSKSNLTGGDLTKCWK